LGGKRALPVLLARSFAGVATSLLQRPQAVEASSPAPEDYDLRLPPVDGMKGAARERKAVYVRP